jgi:Flp pilus assembly pilin Flp
MLRIKYYRFFCKRLLGDEEGATTIEYAVMVSLIGAAVIASVGQVATATKNTFNTSGSAINGVLTK